MSRVLLTGGTGFIGSRVGPLLQARGYEVHAATRSSPPDSSSLSWHQADLFDANAVGALMSRVRPEVLVHLAWLTTPGRYLGSEENVGWLRSSLQLIEDFVRHDGTRVVWAGTCLEYDAWAAAPFVEGVTPTRPESLYAVCKHALAEVLQTAASAWGVETCWGRIFNVYGPGEHESRLVAGTIEALAEERAMSLSEGSQQRDFLHVDDVAAGMAVLADSHQTGPVNVCSGEGMSVRDVARQIGDMMGRPHLVELGTRPSAGREPPAIVGDNRLLTSLGWSQAVEWENCLRDAIRRSTQKTDV